MLLSPTHRWDKVPRTVLAHECSEPIESCFSVESDCPIRTPITVLEEAFLTARETLLQVVENLTTSLVGIALPYQETCRCVSSMVTAFVTTTYCIPITYKRIFLQWLASQGRK